MSIKEKFITFACQVYNKHYGTDRSFKEVAEELYNTEFKNELIGKYITEPTSIHYADLTPKYWYVITISKVSYLFRLKRATEKVLYFYIGVKMINVTYIKVDHWIHYDRRTDIVRKATKEEVLTYFPKALDGNIG